MGIVSILLWAAVMMSAVLLLLRHRAVPFGGLALVLVQSRSTVRVHAHSHHRQRGVNWTQRSSFWREHPELRSFRKSARGFVAAGPSRGHAATLHATAFGLTAVAYSPWEDASPRRCSRRSPDRDRGPQVHHRHALTLRQAQSRGSPCAVEILVAVRHTGRQPDLRICRVPTASPPACGEHVASDRASEGLHRWKPRLPRVPPRVCAS
jgi:hypothetical protein